MVNEEFALDQLIRPQVLKVILLVALLGSLIVILTPFLSSLAMGVIFGLVFIPARRRMTRWKISKHWAAAALVTGFALIVFLPSAFLVVRGSKSLVDFLQDRAAQVSMREPGKAKPGAAPVDSPANEAMTSYIGAKAVEIAERFGLNREMTDEFVRTTFSGAVGFVTESLETFLRQLPQFGIGMLIVLLTIYFLVADAEKFGESIVRASPFSRSKLERVAIEMNRISQSVVVSSVAGGFVQALIYTIGALVLRADSVVVIAFSVFLLSFIPLVGTAPVALVMAAHHFLNSETGFGFAWLVVGAIAGVSDNIVKPYVVGSGVKIHPFLALLTILGGIVLLGLPGLFIGPFLAGLLSNCMPIILESDS